MRWATVWRLHFAADLAEGMLIRFAVARSRAKIWTTIGSASHSLARDSCLRGDVGKMARIALGMSASVFLAISRLASR